jgi:hypothetical protein
LEGFRAQTAAAGGILLSSCCRAAKSSLKIDKRAFRLLFMSRDKIEKSPRRLIELEQLMARVFVLALSVSMPCNSALMERSAGEKSHLIMISLSRLA